MKCPSCNQTATSLLRHAFSLQGVPFLKSIRGHLKCQHCGTHLRIAGFRKQFWFFPLLMVVLLALFLWRFYSLFSSVGPETTVLLWVAVVLIAVALYDIGMWKYGRLEVAPQA